MKTAKKRTRKKNNLKLKLLIFFLVVLTMGVVTVGLHYYTAESFMVLNGEPEVTIGLNGIFDDPGVEAKLAGVDLSGHVKSSSDVDVTVPGTYTISYRCGNFKEQRTVTVLDEMTPRLKLKGDGEITILLGEQYTEPGYEASDKDGTDLTGKVSVSKTSFDRAGTYEVIYRVFGQDGNGTQLTRTVNVEPNTSYEAAGLPICMYHYVYDALDPPADVNGRWKNYISAQDLTAEIEWLKQEHYYFPDWQEVRDYIDGKLLLPAKSIVLTFDDGERATLEKLVPLLEKEKVPATSFLITSKGGKKKVRDFQSEYLRIESHTHDMHRAGWTPGHKGLFSSISEEEGMQDLNTSIEICGSHDAFAYPYGDYIESSRNMLEKAGFLCAVTTQYNKAYPGMDPLLLPRLRMIQDQSLQYFQSVVSPPAQFLETQQNGE